MNSLRFRAAAVVLLTGLCRWASSDVTLELSKDRLFLSDGSVVECTLIAKGRDSVTVLVGEEEKTFPASSVIRVEKGVVSGGIRTFVTSGTGGDEAITGGAAARQAVGGMPPVPPVFPLPPRKRWNPRSLRWRKSNLQPGSRMHHLPAPSPTCPLTCRGRRRASRPLNL